MRSLGNACGYHIISHTYSSASFVVTQVRLLARKTDGLNCSKMKLGRTVSGVGEGRGSPARAAPHTCGQRTCAVILVAALSPAEQPRESLHTDSQR